MTEPSDTRPVEIEDLLHQATEVASQLNDELGGGFSLAAWDVRKLLSHLRTASHIADRLKGEL